MVNWREHAKHTLLFIYSNATHKTRQRCVRRLLMNVKARKERKAGRRILTVCYARRRSGAY